jgi:hypothetical protein
VHSQQGSELVIIIIIFFFFFFFFFLLFFFFIIVGPTLKPPVPRPWVIRIGEDDLGRAAS